MVSLRCLGQSLRALAISLLVTGIAPLPIQAAEEVSLDFGQFSRTISAEALEEFAETGNASGQLAVFLRRLNPDQQATLRTALTTSREVDLLHISQWFNTQMGERTLLFLGKFAQTEARLNGQRALRAAITAAAAEDGDIALIDVVRHFPTDLMRLDVAQVLRTGDQIADEVSITQQLLDRLRQQARDAIDQAPSLDLSTLPDLTQPGPYGSRRISLVLEDTARNRTFPAELYVPQNLSEIQGTIPIVVISHGLGDSPDSFLDIASHVASHGFMVALPEHIGSNFAQKQAMFNWLSDETFKAREFLDRPLDVSYLLDELERLNATTFDGKLDVNRVAAIGHSFGGYTALALGGATIDFERLAQRCNPEANLIVDAAMVLECQALELSNQPEVIQHLGETGVQDERVKLVMAFATVSNLLGSRGISRIDVPVMIFSGAFDILTPVVPQQISAFGWLTTPDRYLYLAENTSHSPGITRLTSNWFNLDQHFDQSVDEALVLTREINKSLIVAFSQVYVADRPEFTPFLSPTYVDAVSQPPFRLYLIRSLPSETLSWLEPAQP